MLEECEGSDEAMGYTYGIVDSVGWFHHMDSPKMMVWKSIFFFFHAFVGVIVLLLGTVL